MTFQITINFTCEDEAWETALAMKEAKRKLSDEFSDGENIHRSTLDKFIKRFRQRILVATTGTRNREALDHIDKEIARVGKIDFLNEYQEARQESYISALESIRNILKGENGEQE